MFDVLNKLLSVAKLPALSLPKVGVSFIWSCAAILTEVQSLLFPDESLPKSPLASKFKRYPSLPNVSPLGSLGTQTPFLVSPKLETATVVPSIKQNCAK